MPTARQDTHTDNMYHSVRPRSIDNAHNTAYVHPATIKINLDVKLTLHLSIIKHHVIKAHGGAEVQFHAFFTPDLHKRSGVTSGYGLLTSGEGANCIK